MANLPGFIEEYTVTIPTVGTSLVAANVTLPHAPPAQGLIYQIEAVVTVGPATAVYATLDTPANGDTILTVEDASVPGDPDPTPWDYSAPTVWYNRTPAGNLRVQVKADVVGPSTIEVKIKIGGNAPDASSGLLPHLFTNKVSFANDPLNTNYDHIVIPAGYRLDTVYVLHDDPADPDPESIPLGGTMTIQRRAVDGTLTSQLDVASPIELNKLDAVNDTLTLTSSAGIDSASGNTASKLTATATNRDYTAGQVCKVTVDALDCADNAELHVWARCVRS